MGEFIIDLAQNPEEIQKPSEKFAAQYQEIENSGIAPNGDNEEPIEEPYFEEIVDGFQMGKENWDSDENQLRGKKGQL